MKMIPSEVLMFMVSAMLCAGCSVKENRDSCPCRLVLDFSEVDTSVVEFADLVMTADGGFVFTDELDSDDFRSGKTVDVPRGEVNVGVWSGTEDMLEDGGLVIPEGQDCPPVYFHTSIVEAYAETSYEKVHMRKNYCRMTINLNYMDVEPWKITVFGKVNGYLMDGTPSEGDFIYGLSSEENGSNVVLLPRQMDDSLAMDIDDGSGGPKRFALGGYIAESGYDWTTPDLEDITIDIDVAFTGITLVIQGWDKVYKFDIAI